MYINKQTINILHIFLTEKDIVECIMERMTHDSKTRGQVIRELKKQSLITSAKDLKRQK